MFLYNYIKEKLTSGFKEQLIATFVASIIASAAVSTYLISTFSGNKVEQNLVSEGFQVTKDFADRNILTLLYLSEESANETVEAIKKFPDVQGVGIYDLEKKPLVEDGENTIPDDAKVWPLETKIVKETDSAWYYVSPVFARGTDPVIADSPFIEEESSRELLGYVRVYVSKNTLHALENSIFQVNIFVTLVVTVLLVFILLAITNRVTKPLNNMLPSAPSVWCISGNIALDRGMSILLRLAMTKQTVQ